MNKFFVIPGSHLKYQCENENRNLYFTDEVNSHYSLKLSVDS
jgi:hypothetical protein